MIWPMIGSMDEAIPALVSSKQPHNPTTNPEVTVHAIPLTVTTVLLGAAALLRDRDWSIGTMESPDLRKFCVVGAIQRTVADAQLADPDVAADLVADATDQLNRTIWEHAPDGDRRPDAATWNDRRCKSRDEAIAMLELAAGAGQ